MSRSAEDIVALYRRRHAELGPLHAKAKEVTETYNGDLVIALPELDKDEKRAVPNLLNQGLNQLAMRVSSTMPDVYFPPDRPGFKQSEEFARIRRQATLGWWEHSSMKLLLARRARHLLGYASTPVVVRYDWRTGVPMWQLRHPLCSFPGEVVNPDDVHPDDCIFTQSRPLCWLEDCYPAQTTMLAKGDHPSPDQRFELLEYMDADEMVLIVLGEQVMSNTTFNGTRPYMELERAPNRAGISPAVVPGRVTLDRRQGAFDGMVGLYQRQAKLMALEVIAVQRGIFPDEWLVARPGENPQIVQQADGMRGVLGIVRGGQIEEKQQNPGYKTEQTISSLERAQRLEGGIPAEFGGESTTNVRTGRRGDSILSAVVDFPVQEAHTILELAMEAENKIAVEMAKAYAGGVRKSFYVNMKGAKGVVDYTPNTHFTSSSNVVNFSRAGADVNSLIIGIGQMIGVGLISKDLGRELNPMIDDPEREHKRVLVEQLEASLLSGLQQGAVSGQLAPSDMAEIMNKVMTSDTSLVEAVQQVHDEAQKRQATAGPAGTPEGPVAPDAPEAQPGIGAPGSSAPAGALPPGTIAPTPDEQGLSKLVGALKGAGGG